MKHTVKHLRFPKAGDAAFLTPHQPDHPEPFGQRGPGLMENGVCGQRGLIAAGLTMV